VRGRLQVGVSKAKLNMPQASRQDVGHRCAHPIYDKTLPFEVSLPQDWPLTSILSPVGEEAIEARRAI
jgi:hypothetical protein